MTRRLLFALLLLAALARVGWELGTTSGAGPTQLLATHLIGDERAYDDLARDFARDRVDRERAFYQEPLYAWIVGQLYSVWPPPALQPAIPAVPQAGVHRAILWLQHALGLLVVYAVFRLGRRVGGDAVGLLAGLFAALSGPLMFHESQLLKATLGLLVFVLALEVWLALLEDGPGRPRLRAFGLGLLLGVGVMLRGNLYLLALAIAASLLFPWGTARRRPRDLALVVFGAVLCVAPLTLANWSRGELVLTTYQAATNVAIGQPDDDDPHNGIIYTPLRASRGDARFEEADAVAFAEAATGRRLSGPEVSSWWWSEVGRRVEQRPGVALQRVAWKLLHLIHGTEVPDVKDYSFFSVQAPWVRSPLSDLSWLGSWGLLAALLLPWRGKRELFVLRVGLATVAISLALFYVMGRYRLTAAPVLWILAAAGLVELRTRWASLGAGARAWVVGLGLGLPLGLGALSLPSDVNGDHVSYANAASIARGLAEVSEDPNEARRLRDQAVAWSSTAIDIAPAFTSPRMQLVRALQLQTPALDSRAGELELPAWQLLLLAEGLRTRVDVMAELRAPLAKVRRAALTLGRRASSPEDEAFVAPTLATALAWASRHEPPERDLDAIQMLNRSLALIPDDGAVLSDRGRRLRRVGRPAEAEADYRAAIALGLDSFQLRNNLANALRDQRRWDEALEQYDAALALSPGQPGVLANRARAVELSQQDP